MERDLHSIISTFRKNRQTKCLADMTRLHRWGMLWASFQHGLLVTQPACFLNSSIVFAQACYLNFGRGITKFPQGVNISCICGIFFVLYRISRSRKDIISLDMLSICLLVWSRQKNDIQKPKWNFLWRQNDESLEGYQQNFVIPLPKYR